MPCTSAIATTESHLGALFPKTHLQHYLCYAGLQHKGHLAVIESALEGENWS